MTPQEQNIYIAIQKLLFEIEEPARRLAILERMSKKMRQANGVGISKEVKSFANKLLRETKIK